MSQKRVLVSKLLRIAILAILLVNSVQPGWRAARAQSPAGFQGQPAFAIYLNEKEVRAAGWPDGVLLSLAIDDPVTPELEYADQQKANTFTGSDPQAVFSLGGLTLKPGLTVTLTDGTAVKSLTTGALIVSNVNWASDTITGTAETDSLVDIGPLCSDHCAIRHAVTGADGVWTADFSQPGSAPDEQDLFDIRPGDSSAARVVDSDGDAIVRTWRVASPNLIVLPQTNQVKGSDWPAGVTVTLTVNNPDNGPETDYQAEIQPIVQPGDTAASFDTRLQGYTLSPGDKVTAVSDAFTRIIRVTQLKITRVDSIRDTVAGTAEPGAKVVVSMDQPDGPVHRQVTANPGNGSWKADFSSPGDHPGETETPDILPGSSGWANEYDAEDNSTQVAWRSAQPTLRALLIEDEIQTMDWPLGIPVGLTITGTNGSSIYQDTQSAVPSPWNPAETLVEFRLNGVRMQAGMTINLTDGATQKTHRLQTLNVTWTDIDRDTIIGQAEPNTRVAVVPACGRTGGCPTRIVKTDNSGSWLADFSRPGQGSSERATLDLIPGMRGEAQITGDVDGDTVVASWQALDPTITAYPQIDQVTGDNWPVDGPTLLTVNDPGTPDAVDFQATADVQPDPANPTAGHVSFDLNGYNLKPGDQVTLTNGPATRSMRVSTMQVTSANPSTDTVEGTGSAGGSIQVWADRSNGSIYRRTQADGGGNWKVDFSATSANPEEKTYDIHPGESGQALETGADGGSTQVTWNASSPRIEVRPADGILIAREWPEGTVLTVTVDALSANTPQATYSLLAVLSDQGDGTEARLNLDHPLHKGDFIRVSGADITREITLTGITVTGIDRRTRTVSGKADPNTSIYVELADQPTCNQWAIADGRGAWTASFASLGDACAIHSGAEILARQPDADDDATVAAFSAPVPYLSADSESGLIEARNWPLGETISLTITDPQQSGAYTAEKNSRRETTGGASVAVFNLNNFHLKAGQTVTASDGVDTKKLIVPNLTAKVDPQNDRVTGITLPGQSILAWVDGANGQRTRTLNASSGGSYTADFSSSENGGAVDITFGTTGGVRVTDDDQDQTSLTWRVPDPVVHVAPGYPEVHGHGDWLGQTITLTIHDGPNQEDPLLYRAQRAVDENSWCGEPCFDLRSAGFALQPGQYVTLTDGQLTKTVMVGNLYITRVDIASDVIRGAADPGAQVVVGINDKDGVTRTITADASGSWRADFSKPGTLDTEENTVNIADGDSGWALLAASDNPEDGTLAYWDAIQAECSPGKSISGEAVKTGKLRGAGSNVHAPVKITFTDYRTGKLIARTIAKPDGKYSCSLPAGTYRVFAETDGYSTEYYDNRPNESVTQVTVTSGGSVTGIDFDFDTPSFAYTHIDFNFARPLSSDRTIRQAIARAVNRERLIADQMPSSPVLDSILPSGDPRYPEPDSGLPHYTYNPTEAKRLLEDAGWVDQDGDGVREKNGTDLRLTLVVVNQPLERAAAARVQADLAAVGIGVTVRSYKANGDFFGENGVLAKGDFDLAVFAWKFGLNAEYGGYVFHQYAEPNYTVDYGKYASAAADALIDQADARSSYSARIPLYQQHQVTIMKDLATLPLFWHVISDTDLDGVDDRHDPCPLDAQDACGGL